MTGGLWRQYNPPTQCPGHRPVRYFTLTAHCPLASISLVILTGREDSRDTSPQHLSLCCERVSDCTLIIHAPASPSSLPSDDAADAPRTTLSEEIQRYYCLDREAFDAFDTSKLSSAADLWLRRLQRETLMIAFDDQHNEDAIPQSSAKFDEQTCFDNYNDPTRVDMYESFNSNRRTVAARSHRWYMRHSGFNCEQGSATSWDDGEEYDTRFACTADEHEKSLVEEIDSFGEFLHKIRLIRVNEVRNHPTLSWLQKYVENECIYEEMRSWRFLDMCSEILYGIYRCDPDVDFISFPVLAEMQLLHLDIVREHQAIWRRVELTPAEEQQAIADAQKAKAERLAGLWLLPPVEAEAAVEAEPPRSKRPRVN